MTRAANSSLPRECVLPLSWSKKTPGERCIWRDDHALGAVDDEGAVLGHERDVAHIDVLLLDVLDRLGAGFLVHIEHDQAQRHLQRRGIGHGALLALLDVVFRVFEVVIDIFEERILGEILDREHGREDRLQALVQAAAFGLRHLEELVVGGLLDLDEVRHLRHFDHLAEVFAKPFASRERESHSVGSLDRQLPQCSENHRPSGGRLAGGGG